MMPARPMGVRCPHCGSHDTHECVRGMVVTTEIWCASCGRTFSDGTETIRIKRKLTNIAKLEEGGEK